MPSRRFRSASIARVAILAGLACVTLGAIFHILAHNIFDAETFGDRAAKSLNDPGVAAFVSDSVTNAIVHSKPDLITVRPLILAATESLLSTRPFQAIGGAAARRAHEAAFSEGARRVLVALPDFHILLRESLQQASPELAAKLPRQLESAANVLSDARWAQPLAQLGHLRRVIHLLWPALFLLGTSLLAFAVYISPNHRRTVVHCGIGLLASGLLLAALLPAGSLAASFVSDPLQAGLLRGLWRTYFGDLWNWAIFLGGLGILTAAGAASLLEAVDPIRYVSRWSRILVAPPPRPAARAAWGALLLATGLAAVHWPSAIASAAIVLAGAAAAYIGVRELFRLFLERVAQLPPDAQSSDALSPRAWLLATSGVFAAVALLAAAWAFWRHPFAPPAQQAQLSCNGHPELCARRLDQVVFAGAHNAMSNHQIPGWMFPHHEKSIPGQLRDGIRALLIDVHAGFPGGDRIKTDMNGEPIADKVRQSIGAEGYSAALRIRNQLVGVDQGKRGLYLCHGVCELGAYPLTPLLAEVHDFLISHPDEVVIMIIEDYAKPAEIAQAFQDSNLESLVYKGSPSPHWPTLGQLIQTSQRLVVFLESGRPGVSWLRPAFQSFMETPYSFKTPQDFSCRPNRGNPNADLFLINHWIETTPTPKPSNAAIVNAYQPLLARAQACAAERHHIPNILAVDFYHTGDLLKVVDTLNGFPPVESPL